MAIHAGAALAAGVPQATPPSCGNSGVRVPDIELCLSMVQSPTVTGEDMSHAGGLGMARHVCDRHVLIALSLSGVSVGRGESLLRQGSAWAKWR